jgi:hypothetical protein
MGHRLEDRASAARCPIQPIWTFANLCRSYGAAPGFGYGSYKDFAPTELRPSGDMSAANMYGPRSVRAKSPKELRRSGIFVAHSPKMRLAPLGATYL